MTRAIFTWTIGAWLLACTSTTKIHMEEVEDNGGAAGEASTSEDEANTGGSSADGDAVEATTGSGGATNGVSDGH